MSYHSSGHSSKNRTRLYRVSSWDSTTLIGACLPPVYRRFTASLPPVYLVVYTVQGKLAVNRRLTGANIPSG